MNRIIDINEAVKMSEAIIVDVRSEGEFAEATIPGAINLPLLDNMQRALVGIAYKEQGSDAARSLGLDLVAPGLGRYVESFRRLAPGGGIILFCWRGGLRSKFVAELLDTMGLDTYRLKGGFKSYRRFVNDYLGRDALPQQSIVLHGLTGVGKTEVLAELKQAGMPVLDLEGMARHRGSVYGKIGLPRSPSQKMFEALIVQELMNAEQTGFFVVECEGRRLGKLLVPEILLQAIKSGRPILLYAELEQRVRRIKDIYAGREGGIQALQESTSYLTRYLGRKKVEELNTLLAAERLEDVFSYLLTNYYDPLYKYPACPSRDYELCVDTADIRKAARRIREYIIKLPEY